MHHELRALVVTPDSTVAGIFAEISREVGIEAHASVNALGIPQELEQSKYQAVVLDFDRVPDAGRILAKVRQHPSNKDTVIFALASNCQQGQEALLRGANLLFERPVRPEQIRRAIHAAYDLMARERRRYFRCAANIPVLLIHSDSGADCRCTSINISSSGLALSTPVAMKPGDNVQIILSLPGSGSPIRALGSVIWDDKHGRCGLSFVCSSYEHQKDLDQWLDGELQKMLASDRSGDTCSK